jgi:hypothetical protein
MMNEILTFPFTDTPLIIIGDKMRTPTHHDSVRLQINLHERNSSQLILNDKTLTCQIQNFSH